jgi:hypothetical protein
MTTSTSMNTLDDINTNNINSKIDSHTIIKKRAKYRLLKVLMSRNLMDVRGATILIAVALRKPQNPKYDMLSNPPSPKRRIEMNKESKIPSKGDPNPNFDQWDEMEDAGVDWDGDHRDDGGQCRVELMM